MKPKLFMAIKVLSSAFASSVLLWMPQALAQLTDPLEDFFVTDGYVYALTKTNDVLYLGGSFTSIGRRTGGGVPVSLSTGQAESPFPIINGRVDAAITDGSGGWFVGGAFTRAGGSQRTNLAHILADRTLDPNWQPSALGDHVGGLILMGDTVYLSGNFTNVNGVTRNRVAAVDKTNGSLLNWDPNANAEVRAMAENGSTIYLAGRFTSIGAQPRIYITQVDAITGVPTAWNPVVGGWVETLLISDGRLFVGGWFPSIGGQTRSCAAAFDLGTGLVNGWNPNVSDNNAYPVVFKLAANQNTIFMAGRFNAVGGNPRVHIGAVDATTGVASGWNAQAAYGVPNTLSIEALGIFSNTVFVGGTMLNIGGQPRSSVAALNIVSGNATAWNPVPNGTVPKGTVKTLAASGDTIYIGGLFSSLTGLRRTNLAAINLTNKQVTPWNPATTNTVYSLMTVSNRIYIGGEFARIGGVVRSNLAAVDLTNGTVLPWNPNLNGYVLALATFSNRLYIVGGFTKVNGSERTNIAAVDLDTGALTSWSPVFDQPIMGGSISTLANAGNTLYVGGFFRTVNGVTRRQIAAFDLNTGDLTSWNPDIAFSSNFPRVGAIFPYQNRVYVGGDRIKQVGGLNRTNLFVADASTAQVLPWSPNPDGSVYALTVTSNLVFVGGDFNNAGGENRDNLAVLDSSTGQATPWNLNPNPGAVRRLLLDDGVLYVGGTFGSGIVGTPSSGLEAFSLRTFNPPIVQPNSLASSGEGAFHFQFRAAGATRATVWVSTNLPEWQTLQSVTLSNGDAQFTDQNASNHPVRFYRISLP